MLVYEKTNPISIPDNCIEISLADAFIHGFDPDIDCAIVFPKNYKELFPCEDYYSLFKTKEFYILTGQILSMLVNSSTGKGSVYLKDNTLGYQLFDLNMDEQKLYFRFGPGYYYFIDSNDKVSDINRDATLYGTFGDIPDDGDSELEYTTSEGEPIDDLSLNEIYLDDGHGGIIRESDDEDIQVLLEGTIIIPNTGELQSIEITNMPDILEYDESSDHNLDLTGLVVSAVYESGIKQVVTDYTTDPAEGYHFEDTSESGEYTASVTITYQSKTVSFDVTVIYPRE